MQVVKEERGNKGAALTTYLSLAGRYCVLMPNTSRGGGISRKITNASDRRRLQGDHLGVRGSARRRPHRPHRRRQAHQDRSPPRLRIPHQALAADRRQDDGVHGPALIHEEGHLVLRAVRDLYDKDVERIIVEGEEAYNEARTFVKMLMPSHTRKVVQHEDNGPLFVLTGVEDQLEGIYSPTVQLPSGGYIVINQTEALVAIDVNSGKATRERNVEATALKTNHGSGGGSLPPDAPARSCRPHRDRFHRHGGQQEQPRCRKEDEGLPEDRPGARSDRPHLPVRPIRNFRQRRRAGVLELSSELCDHCGGTGRVRSIESAGDPAPALGRSARRRRSRRERARRGGVRSRALPAQREALCPSPTSRPTATSLCGSRPTRILKTGEFKIEVGRCGELASPMFIDSPRQVAAAGADDRGDEEIAEEFEDESDDEQPPDDDEDAATARSPF